MNIVVRILSTFMAVFSEEMQCIKRPDLDVLVEFYTADSIMMCSATSHSYLLYKVYKPYFYNKI